MYSEAIVANCGQAFVNVLFGAASVISSLGMREFHPLIFGLIRALLTGILLILLRWDERLICCGSLKLARNDVLRFCLGGFFLFVGEFFYILGVEFSGSIRASLWQPSQPIWTMLVTAALGHERMNIGKAFGVFLAFSGCVIMILGRSEENKNASERTLMRDLFGNIFLFINCSLGTPLYIISVKPLLYNYPTFSVAGLTFAINTIFFATATAFAPIFIKDLSILEPPQGLLTWAAVIYVAVFATVLPYAIQMWCTKILPASLVSAYYVLQPVAAAALVYTLRFCGVKHLQGAQPSDLGAIAVFAGLYTVIRATPLPPKSSQNQITADFRESDEDSFLVNNNGARSSNNAVNNQLHRELETGGLPSNKQASSSSNDAVR
mmetsp:Transcript_9634/g.13352  ORF Transcript_9634/g.13352 Transcript_9634/m.13352 type:complete len:379 (-) Transcript_9634:379-1515(-)